MANHRGGSGNFGEDRERGPGAGKKGGKNNRGNFKKDTQRASQTGKKWGENRNGQTANKPGYTLTNEFFSVARQKAITAGYPGGFLFMASDEQLLAVERQPTFCLTTH